MCVLLAALLAGCGNAEGTAAGAAGEVVTAAQGDSVLMAQGLDLLYAKNDPFAAATSFRAVLAQNPEHYGAHYQLATALDRSGLPEEARPLWQKMETLAVAALDSNTLRAVRTRLEQPDTVSQEAAMAIGLNLLYTRREPAAAVDRFRRVLEKNPTHYGARFQLARALEASGDRKEAASVWSAVLRAAEIERDATTADTARARLAILGR